MTAPPSDQLLDKARLISPAYTREELAAAQARMAAAATDHLLSGALTFDDATAADLWSEPARTAPWEPSTDWDTYTDQDARNCQDAAAALSHICRIIVSELDALHTMATFMSGTTGSDSDSSRILDPDGARVLACVLHLAGREDSARFWWQFAAGADDHRAKLCLFLHHRVLGESQEAHWWYQQIPRSGRRGALLDSNLLNIFARSKDVPDAANEVVVYVKSAVRYVDDDVDLPLPADGFAARIEEMTAGV